MTRDQLEELAKGVDWLLVDPPTDERWAWHAREYVQEAAALLRSLLAQVPVAWMHRVRCVPKGLHESSPAIYRWEREVGGQQVLSGRLRIVCRNL